MRAVFNGGFAGRESPLFHLKLGSPSLRGVLLFEVIWLKSKHKTVCQRLRVIRRVYATLKWDQKRR